MAGGIGEEGEEGAEEEERGEDAEEEEFVGWGEEGGQGHDICGRASVGRFRG